MRRRRRRENNKNEEKEEEGIKNLRKDGSVMSQKAMSLQLLQKISGKSMFAENEG